MNTRFIAVIVGAGACSTPSIAEDRSIDGSGNNLTHTSWGSAGSLLSREGSGPLYADGIGAMITSRPNPRVISNALGDQTAPLGNTRQVTSMWWQWGQFLDHDLDLVGAGSEPSPISVPMGDSWLDPGNTGTQVIPFMRSDYAGGAGSPRQHANRITHWMDGSMVYGSDAARATELRTGAGGRLNTSAGDMLPFNTNGFDNDPDSGRTDLYIAGDVRANEVVGLASMHTLFVREHNYHADRIASQNPGWTDEQVYQRARKIVGAEIQAITYNEFLPALLGESALDSYAGYDDTVDPTISNTFATAAYRLGHTMLNEQYLMLDENGNEIPTGHVSLHDAFFDPHPVLSQTGLDPILRGLAAQEANNIDTQLIDDVRNMLFGPPGSGGMDLLALNIQRGRDHGIQDYNTLRADFGLAPVTDWSEITSDPALAADLASVYADINDIDAWIGLMAEDHASGAGVGETLLAILSDQFSRLRDADRFFYLNDPELADLVSEIESTRLSDIILRNTGITDIRGNVFVIPAPWTALLPAAGGCVLALRRRRGERS